MATKELCPIPLLVKCDVSPKSMTVDLSIESNMSTLIWTAVFDGPIDADRLLLQDGIPRIGDKNPFLPEKYATNLSPQPTAVQNVWDIVVSYDLMGAPPIEEGKAYDFGTRSIKEEVAAQFAYERNVYEINPFTKKPVKLSEPTFATAYTNTAKDLFADPIMIPKSDILLSFWSLASLETGKQAEKGSVYKYIGQTNIISITLCGMEIGDYGITIEDIIATKYLYYKSGATTPEIRYKLHFEIRVDPEATGFGTGVVSKGRNAKLYPRGATAGTKELRAIWTSDIDSSITVRGEGDAEIDYDVLLDKDGEILDTDTENTCYIGYVANQQFGKTELPLPSTIGSYAKS